MYVCIYIYIYVYTHVYMCVYLSLLCMCVYIYIYIYIYMYPQILVRDGRAVVFQHFKLENGLQTMGLPDVKRHLKGGIFHNLVLETPPLKSWTPVVEHTHAHYGQPDAYKTWIRLSSLQTIYILSLYLSLSLYIYIYIHVSRLLLNYTIHQILHNHVDFQSSTMI